MIAPFIILIPAIVADWRTDGVLEDVPDALVVIFEHGISNQATSISLIISAIVQAKGATKYLSMYHALIVLNLPWILTLSMCCSLFTAELYEWKNHELLRRKGFVISFVAASGAAFKGAFGLWTSVSPGSFHNNAGGCNSQDGVKFFMFHKDF